MRNKLSRLEENLKFTTRFKYAEQMGRSMRELVVRKDPEPTHCARKEGFPCQSKPGLCMRLGVVYRISCLTYLEKGEKETVYIGELARTLWDSGSEHQKP